MTTFPTLTTATTGGLAVAGTAQNAANIFIPQLWADEILRSLEKNLILAGWFKRVPVTKGMDTFKMPLISDFSAEFKESTIPVSLQANAEGHIVGYVNQHVETSFLIEKLFELQSKYDNRAEYIKKAAYALRKGIDSKMSQRMLTDLGQDVGGNLGIAGIAVGNPYMVIGQDGVTPFNAAITMVKYDVPIRLGGSPPPSNAFYVTVGAAESTALGLTGPGYYIFTTTAAGNTGPITDECLRKMEETLNDNNVDLEDRALFIPPRAKSTILGMDRFTLFHNVDDTAPLRKGDIGEIYGFRTKMSTNLPIIYDQNAYAASGAAKTLNPLFRTVLAAHKDAIGSGVQQDVSVDSQKKVEYLGTMVVTDMVFGTVALRTMVDDNTALNHRLSNAVMAFISAK